MVQPWAAGIHPWKHQGCNKCDHFQHSSNPSVISPLLDTSWTRRPVQSTWRWRFKQKLHSFRGQSLRMSCWGDREHANGIRHSLCQQWSSNPFGMQDRAVKRFSKEVPELEAILWRKSVALNTILELQSAALLTIQSRYEANVAPYWSGLALAASATQTPSLWWLPRIWTYLARQAAGGSLYFPNIRHVRIHQRLLKTCCIWSLSQVHGPNDKAGFLDPKPLMWCGDGDRMRSFLWIG